MSTGPAAAPLPVRHRAAVLALWALLALAAAWTIAHSRFTADLSAFLPAHPDARQQVLIEQLKSGTPARTLLIAIGGGDAAARAAASRALAAGLRASGLFEQVQNGADDGLAPIGRWLFEHRYQLSPAVDAAHFTAQGLRSAITGTLSLLGTPAGNAIKPLLASDPTGETQRIAEALIPARAPRTEDGVWVSRSAPRALLVATVRAAGADLDAQARAIARVRAEFANPRPPGPAAGLTLQMSGAPLFGVDSRAQIEHEIRWLAIAGTALMSTLLLLAFGSLPALGVAMLPVASGVLAGIAAVALVFGSVHGITLGFGTTLIGEAVDYAIYFLIQARAEGWRRWLVTGWPTVRLGLLTSLCGFAALAFSGFPGLAQLGVFSLAGLVGAALATRFGLPALMPGGARARRAGLRPLLGRLGVWGVARLPRLRWPLLALGLAALALLATRPGLWQAELSSLSPVPPAALALDASLRADLSAGDASVLVVVEGADLQTTLQRAEAAAARLDPLVDRGAIGGYDSVTRWLPSAATQQARRASLPDAAALQAALAQATATLPLKPARLAPFVQAVEQARQQPPITRAALEGTALAPLVDALLLQRPAGGWAALLPLQPAGDTLDGAAVQAALQGLPGTQSLTIGHELKRLYARYLGEAQAQALLGALAVVGLMALTLRSPRRLLAVCQPLLLAVLLTMGALAALGVKLGILHLVGLLLVVAVGSNYALFFDLMRQRAGAATATTAATADTAASLGAEADTLASLLLANLTTVLSFGLLALSAIPALSAIGRVVAPGALLALLLSAAFAPGSGRISAPRP